MSYNVNEFSDFSSREEFRNRSIFYLQRSTLKSTTCTNENVREPDPDYSDDDGDERNTSCLSVFKRFSDKTSMQGVPHIINTRLTYAKLLWTILLVLAIGAMLLHLYYLISQYVSWQKQTKIELSFSNIQLPAVTICNMNVVSKLGLRMASKELRDLVAYTDPRRYGPPPDRNRTGGLPPGSRKRFVSEFDSINFTEYRQNLLDTPGNLNTPRDEQALIKMTFERLYMDHERHVRYEMGHRLNHMLVRCSFAGRKCYPENFTTFQTKEYGNCWTLDTDTFVSAAPGHREGLEIVLFMENARYLKGISSGYGARITVHEPNTLPFPISDGFLVSTASETHIALTKTSITRLDGRYGNCKELDSFKKKYGYKFTRQLCLTLCLQDIMINKCGCHSGTTEEYMYQLNYNTTRMCRLPSERHCEAEVLADEENKLISCDCTFPCKQTTYAKTISEREWPTEEYAIILVHYLCQRRPDVCHHLRQQLSLPRNLHMEFLKFVIYYQDLNYADVYETPETTATQFASDIGGAIGLWTALSILSIFEIVQLLMELCVVFKRKFARSMDFCFLF